jgi:hypothetical protein
LVLQRFAQKLDGHFGVAPLLNQHVQNFSFVVDRPLQPHALAVDVHRHFVEMPSARASRSNAPKIEGKQATEFQNPGPDRLIVRLNSALGKHFLDVAQAQGEAEVQPNRVPNDVRRESVPLEGDCLHGFLRRRAQFAALPGESLGFA